jgi:hypothetical protein
MNAFEQPKHAKLKANAGWRKWRSQWHQVFESTGFSRDLTPLIQHSVEVRTARLALSRRFFTDPQREGVAETVVKQTSLEFRRWDHLPAPKRGLRLSRPALKTWR